MKKAKSKWIVMVMASLLLSVFSINTSKAQGSVSIQVFYDELAPYGTWMDYNNYGYVWVPRVDRNFAPYATNGYWINTQYGNTWVSDYSWGWAPFHYGRWTYDDYYGWIWIPDTEWAPAWVAWRSGGGYYGWAPLMPGISINVSFNYYNRIPHHYWSFVPYRYITYRNIYTHCIPRPQVVNIINHTTIITHNHYSNSRRNTYFTGPSRRDIERRNNERVPVYSVNSRNRPGRSEVDRSSVSFYRPEIDNSRRSEARPSRVVKESEFRNSNREQLETRRDRTETPADRRIESQNNDRLERRLNDNSDDFRKRDEEQRKAFEQQERSTQLERTNADQLKQRENTVERNTERRSIERPTQSEQRERATQLERKNSDQFNQRDNTIERNSERRAIERPSTIEKHERNRPEQNLRLEQQRNTQRESQIQRDNQIQRRSFEQPQRQQQVERQSTDRSNQIQRERSVSPGNNRSSVNRPQRQQQTQRSGSEQRSNSGGQRGHRRP